MGLLGDIHHLLLVYSWKYHSIESIIMVSTLCTMVRINLYTITRTYICTIKAKMLIYIMLHQPPVGGYVNHHFGLKERSHQVCYFGIAKCHHLTGFSYYLALQSFLFIHGLKQLFQLLITCLILSSQADLMTIVSFVSSSIEIQYVHQQFHMSMSFQFCPKGQNVLLA